MLNLLQLWLRYPLCWLGLKRLGRYDDAEAIIALAFGRQKVTDENLGQVAIFRQRFGQANGANHQAIDALCQKGFDPGRLNYKLATEVQKTMARGRRSCYLQWEVAAALDPDWYQLNWRWIKVIWPQPGSIELSARDLLLAIKDEVAKRQEKSAAIIAHQGMIVRAALLVKRQLGLEPIIPEQDVAEFDRDSVQPWTRRRRSWLWRETRCRIHHLLHRWI